MKALSARTAQLAIPANGSSFRKRWYRLRRPRLPSQPPAGMVKIPAGDFVFKVNGIEIEGFNEIGVDVQYPWEESPRRHHQHTIHIDSFWIDKYPVTNAEFKKFLDATHYHPKDDLNFLRDWNDGTYPAGWDNKPVTWVSLEDARAYAAWAGKRLAARVGVAIRGARNRRSALSLGQRLG